MGAKSESEKERETERARKKDCVGPKCFLHPRSNFQLGREVQFIISEPLYNVYVSEKEPKKRI